MSVVEVFSDVAGDDGFVCLDQVKILSVHLCGDFEPDMEQLPQAAVISG